jgi:hypothetical protein
MKAKSLLLCLAAAGCAVAPLAAAFAQRATQDRPPTPLAIAKRALVPFDNSPFPYRGEVPGQNKPFLDVVTGERRGHTAPRGGIYWEAQTYSDRRVLLSIPKGFDPRRPALMVVFFHGNQTTLARDVRDRQQVPRQVAESALNAVLVAPQFALDALDSSAGRFWEPGVFGTFVSEAAERLTQLYGDDRVLQTFRGAPIVIVAYSGGYMPAVYAITVGGVADRVRGVVLLDALFAELDQYADWIAQRPSAFFVSAYSRASRGENAELRRLLTERRVNFTTTLPPRLAPGNVSFLAAPDAVGHLDFVTHGGIDDPIKVLLSRMTGIPRLAKP